jgi:hypothetical protein
MTGVCVTCCGAGIEAGFSDGGCHSNPACTAEDDKTTIIAAVSRGRITRSFQNNYLFVGNSKISPIAAKHKRRILFNADYPSVV